jgi:hypothetical protein
MQSMLDRRQRDVDDGEIQHHHELGHRQHQQQREPRSRAARRGLVRAWVTHVCRRLHRTSSFVCVQAAANYSSQLLAARPLGLRTGSRGTAGACITASGRHPVVLAPVCGFLLAGIEPFALA